MADQSLVKKALALRPFIEAELASLGSEGLQMFQAEIAAGQFTGILAPFQPEFAEVKCVVDFLSGMAALYAKLHMYRTASQSQDQGQDKPPATPDPATPANTQQPANNDATKPDPVKPVVPPGPMPNPWVKK